MELSLFISYTLPIVIFAPIYLYYFKKNDNLPEITKLVILGGLGWAILAIITLIPFSFLIESSSENRYMEVFDVNGDDNRTPLFWLIFVFSVCSEIIKFYFVRQEKDWIGNYRSLAIFGAFWGLFEFLSRFAFFFEDNSDNQLSILFILVFIILLNTGLSMIILRTEENTKFIMFSSIMRFFSELAIFGAFGHDMEENERISRLSFVLFLHLFIVYLSVLTRKPLSTEVIENI